ncbi:MAG: T9SS type A sorting domain-containing protein, partial [Candidatus Sabulitectum sp.]|nr:T9SS type A sorting domain-containing protein [Candidatus Sabulitectum sp.]
VSGSLGFKASVQPDSVYWSPYQIAGNYPGVSSIDVLDVDLDGDLDIVVAENNNSRITYLECITWYTEFEAHVIDSAIPHPMCIRLGNIDNDNYPDVAVCCFDNSAVYWYRNLLTGWEKHTVTDSLWGAAGVTICDITENEDGWHNIVVAGCYDGDVRWYEHTAGDEWNEYIMGDLPGASALCATELDTIPGLEITGVAGVGDAIKFWSPGFHTDEGELISAVFDGLVGRLWTSISWEADIPSECTLGIQVRGSDDWENMGSWSEELFEPTELYEILTDTTRYFQYRVILSTTDPTETPVLNEITLSWDDVGIEETSTLTIPEQSLQLISPNPSRNTIEFSVTTLQHSSIRLLDLTGRVVEEFTTPDSGIYSFLSGELAPGLYFLQTDMKDIPVYRIVIIN